MKEKAFTLAEVLITIGIIGIVAATTLPALISKHQKNVTVNKLKKSYTTISNMFLMAQKDYGDSSSWSFSFGELSDYNNSLKTFVEKYMLPYLNVIDNCGILCSKTPTYKFLNNTNAGLRTYYSIYLKDGSIIYVAMDNDTINVHSIIMYVDINGQKKPNIIGKDVFAYYLNASNINKSNFWGFWGGASTPTRNGLLTNSRGCNKNGSGQYCGALIQVDGWQIKDDYPW